MRILISNPDRLGDVVRRQPLFAALTAAGHELLLLARAATAALLPQLAPGAHVVHISSDSLTPPGPELTRTVQHFRPELVLLPGRSRAVFETRLVAALPGVAVIGRRGPLTELDENSPTAREDILSELRVYEQLAAKVLGQPVSLPNPRLVATAAQVQAGEAEVQRQGLTADSYWAACVGSLPGAEQQSWPSESWGRVLACWAHRYERRFLFLGQTAERDSILAIQEAMGQLAGRTAVALLDPGSLDLLIGLLHLSRGYVGRERDAMHLAAALGKPVVAVCGGGHWPACAPAGEPSCALTVGVACAGCGGNCHLPEPYCIRQLPVEEVLRAIEDLETGRLRGRELRALAPDPLLSARMLRESADSARQSRLRSEQLEAELAIARQIARSVEVSFAEREHDLRVREEQMAQRELELKARFGAQLLSAQRETEAALSRERDLTQKLEQMERAHAALVNHLEQIRKENQNLQQQVDELRSSRWRRIGMKIGIAKKTSWERLECERV
jgi:ADP-heptose:LPS heptosyltransferase